jgi:hypothetical protein
MSKFTKGQSGNPAGRPLGRRDRRVAMREMLQPYADELVAKVVEMAKGGDVAALRICIERLIPPVKEERLSIELPSLVDIQSCADAQKHIVLAVSVGTLLPGEGNALSSLVENQRKSFETLTLEQRLKTVEDKMGAAL